jgi:nucleotide-binding universal stress UspA family protein
MIAVNKILVPIDFSATSTRVLDFARMLADACRASLHLVHVIGYPLATPESESQERRAAGTRLDALLDRVDRDDRHATTCCEVGTPALDIVRYATANEIDLIVMGTHSHGPTHQMITGSIAEAVVRMAPCAVLAVKGVMATPAETAFNPVGVAADGS